jgi:putative tricarboxylic transport membrane protein
MSSFGLLDGLLASLSLGNLFCAAIGCLLGTLVGILPGLGPASTMAILLPVAIYLPPEGSVILLGGIYYGAMYGGSTTAILMNIPGEVASSVTALDGYAMCRQGRAGEALAIAGIGSFIAGIAGAVAVAYLGPLVGELALLFGPPEYLGLIVFSMTALVSFAGRSLLMGISMAMLGVWLASLGSDPLTGTPRLTFGSLELRKGFDIIPVMVGIFGIGEVLFNVGQKMERTNSGKVGSWLSMLPRGGELRRGIMASGRGTVIGGVMGLIPGMVPALTAYLAYDFEKRISREPGRFGQGAIEGVASPEAANNATAMAGFIPLLSLGIPTSPALVIVLGALIMNGVTPGPTMFTHHGALAFTVVASMFISNAMLLVLNLPLVGVWARVSSIPYSVLAPVVLAVCVLGAYAPRNTMTDVAVALGAGLFGYAMRRWDWPMPPLLLGFLLGPMFESALRQTLSLSGGSLGILFNRAMTVGFFCAAAIVLVSSLYIRYRSSLASRIMSEGTNEI